ncbi:hypothetical protein H4R18_003918 [Coemansia javaensis]|uniref:Uncharacterized protein n=1 Tax=Coemansia javaensis TaxID=2761396 RepID=A0A9W8LHN3_9FUNG|nr:hypothetical protein H4R18_003918 [Coemansia javaensis]
MFHDGQMWAALQTLTNAACESCIVSYAEWRGMRELLDRNVEWAADAESVLYSAAIIDIPAGGEGEVPRSNIPDIVRRGYCSRVKYLVVHAAGERNHPHEFNPVYTQLQRIFAAFADMPTEVRFMSHSPTRLLGMLVPVVELAVRKMPNLRGVLVSRVGAHDASQRTSAEAHRHISYCAATCHYVPQVNPQSLEGMAAAQQGGQPQGAPQVHVAPDSDRHIAALTAETPDGLPLLTSSLDYISSMPLPRVVLRRIGGYTATLMRACAHSLPPGAAIHIRRHLHFIPGLRFVSFSGSVCAFDWCRVAMTEVI